MNTSYSPSPVHVRGRLQLFTVQTSDGRLLVAWALTAKDAVSRVPGGVAAWEA